MIDTGADRRAHEEHQAIYAAVKNRDPVLAHATALTHVPNTQRWCRQMLEATDLKITPDAADASPDAPA